MSNKDFREEESLGKPFDMKLMRRLLTYARPYMKPIFFCFFLLALITLTDLARPYLIKVAIDDHISKGDLSGLFSVGAAFFAIISLGFIMNYIQIYVLNYTGQKIIMTMRRELFAHVHRLPLSFFDRTPVGRLVTRVTNDMETLNNMYTDVLVDLFKDVMLILGVIAAMFMMDYELALSCLSTMPVIGAVTFIFRKRVRDAYRKTRVRLARINSALGENIMGMRVIQLFSQERRKSDEFESINKDYLDASLSELLIYAVFRPGMDLIYSMTLSLLLTFGIFSLYDGRIQFGVLFAFISYIQTFFQPIGDLADKFNIMQGAMASSERIFMLLDEKEENFDTPPHWNDDASLPDGDIEFRNVWFDYGDGVHVLKDMSFTIEKGATVAFVGSTGAGKTTIISLLARFYEIEKGEILIGGVDIREIPLQTLRQSMGTVLQDVFLFSGDIASNIRLGNEDITDEDVESASMFVNASHFIEKLEGQYKARVNERGTTLSSGQRQLLSLARAIAFNPRILILDEATSSIDTESERLIQDAIGKVVKGRTTIVIAHRLSTIQHADKIIVMGSGRIMEEGTHDELLSRGGIYYDLYRLQYER
jgi:ATP-binding cassette, subfamily B, multidrug efflux pump